MSDSKSLIEAKQTPQNGVLRLLHEILFSLNVSLSLTAFVLYGLANLLNWPVWKMDVVTGFTRNNASQYYLTPYWYLIPALAACSWLLLRLFRRAPFTIVTLRSVAGILAIAAAPLWSTQCGIGNWHGASAVLHNSGFYELVVAFVCVALYLKDKWSVPSWGNFLLLAGHYTFWIWEFRGYLKGYWIGLGAFLNYAVQERSWFQTFFGILRVLVEQGWSGNANVTALMPIVGLLAGFAWALYVFEESDAQSG